MAVVAAQWPIWDLSAMLLMVDFQDALLDADGAASLTSLLTHAAGGIKVMTAAGLADRGFELAKRVGELGGSSDEMLTVAGGCLHAALIATGDRDSAALVGKIVQRDDTPDVDPLVALESLRPVHPDRAGVRPFDHPTHWGGIRRRGS